ncbi:hypothetical protein EXIGUO8A_10467 [Exiguobacterium sp. 8A]|nr:hypothetical protein EXIGUO8A_10467 [Exiguobacterium sp. 8A]
MNHFTQFFIASFIPYGMMFTDEEMERHIVVNHKHGDLDS